MRLLILLMRRNNLQQQRFDDCSTLGSVSSVKYEGVTNIYSDTYWQIEERVEAISRLSNTVFSSIGREHSQLGSRCPDHRHVEAGFMRSFCFCFFCFCFLVFFWFFFVSFSLLYSHFRLFQKTFAKTIHEKAMALLEKLYPRFKIQSLLMNLFLFFFHFCV